MKTALLLTCTLLVFSLVTLQDDRTANFPRYVQYADSMPPPCDTWVFILAGQSNMAGRGFVEPQDTVPDRKILALMPDDRWVIAKEPLQQYQPSLTGLGPGLAFAREIAEKTNHRYFIALVPCAVGGSSVDDWLNDSLLNGVRLKSNFTEKMKIARKTGIIKGIIWHQGESDADTVRSAVYENKLLDLFRFFRQQSETDTLPVIMGELGLFPGNSARSYDYNVINKILGSIAGQDPHIRLVPSEGLSPNPDNVHFNGPSQRIMGKRYADAYLELVNNK